MKTLRQLEYEFENIETLIRSAIDPSTKSNKSFDERFARVRNAVAVERDRIKKSFVLNVWALENNKREHCVQYHQHRLIILIDELFEISIRKGERPGFNSRIASEAFFLYDQLEDVLNLMRSELSGYFSFDAKIPKPHKVKAFKSIQKKYGDLQDLMTGKENALLSICCDCIQELLDGKESRTTYKRLHYMEMLVESMTGLFKNGDVEFLEDKIQSLLNSINFNSTDYFKHYVARIQNQIAELGSDAERLEKLAFHYKIINQVQPIGGQVYDPNSKGIKIQLTEWISEEVQFLERKRDLTTASHIAEKEFTRKDFKLEFDMSVSQFAFFIKAFIETGVIQNKNISELIRFLARFVKTKRSENISYESFRIKYYNVESGTKDAVKNSLHSAIGFINSN